MSQLPYKPVSFLIDKHLEEKYHAELIRLNNEQAKIEERKLKIGAEKIELKKQYEKYYSLYDNKINQAYISGTSYSEIFGKCQTERKDEHEIRIDPMLKLALETLLAVLKGKGFSNSKFEAKFESIRGGYSCGGGYSMDGSSPPDYNAWYVFEVNFF